MFKDLGSVVLQNLLATAARTTTANGTGVDLKDFIGQAALILDSAAGTGTTPTLDLKLQDSDDNSTFADVSPAVAFVQVVAGASQQRVGVDCDALRRYVRIVSTIGGTTPSFTYSVNMVGRKQVFP